MLSRPEQSRHSTHPHVELHARQLRAWVTPSEARLWEALSRRQLGVQFRRQVVLGGRFIADFVAFEARLVVEVDGGYHRARRRADASRDRKLQRLGYSVLRLEAELVMERLPEAVARVREALLP